LLSLLTGDNAVAHDALDYEMQAMQRELLGSFPSSLETLLVERICSCYLHVQYAESISFTYGHYLQRQVNLARLGANVLNAGASSSGLPDVDAMGGQNGT